MFVIQQVIHVLYVVIVNQLEAIAIHMEVGHIILQREKKKELVQSVIEKKKEHIHIVMVQIKKL